MVIFNKYRDNTPLSKWIINDLIFVVKSIVNYFKNGLRRKTVLFYPEYPSKCAVIWKVLKQLNYNVSNNINRYYCLAINWEDITKRRTFDKLERISQSMEVLNIHVKDIGKNVVDSTFNNVFGYSTIIDPVTHTGKCVKKSNDNATHDGVVLECPISSDDVDPNYIYQILVDNKSDSNTVKDIRVPVFKGKIPFVYLKHHSTEERFSNANAHTVIRGKDEILSNEEINLVDKFCQQMQLDYGELDILRDRISGKLYVIDVNYTPWGPPNHLSKEDSRKAVKVLSKYFQKYLVNSSR